MILITLVLSTVFSIFKDLDINPVIAFVIVVFVFLAIFIIVFNLDKYFEYDSDGLKAGIMNKGLLSTDYLKSKEHTLEFDKNRLVSFKFRNYIVQKCLVLYLLNKRGHKKKEVFDVTLVSRKKRKYVRQSLNKILRNNKKKAIS